MSHSHESVRFTVGRAKFNFLVELKSLVWKKSLQVFLLRPWGKTLDEILSDKMAEVPASPSVAVAKFK